MKPGWPGLISWGPISMITEDFMSRDTGTTVIMESGWEAM
jgi:hypothetical protein